MPDGGNQGSVGRRRGAHHVLIGKANQIFESAAATRHDDHIHIWIGIQLPDGRYHVRRALLALHVHMRHLEADDGPTRRTLVMTSPSARACGAQIKPMQCGNSGNGFLRSASNRPSPLSFLRSSSIMAFRLPPAPAAMIASPRNDSDVRFIHTFGLPWMMTRSPCTNGAAAAANRPEAR